MDWFIFFRALGVITLFLSLLSGILYWVYTALKKSIPNLKYKLKYDVFRRKYNEQDVASLLDHIDKGTTDKNLIRDIILSNETSPEKASELLYIYRELKKLQLKGGKLNE